MDWSALACGRGGHVTYAPDEPELRDRLCVDTHVGTAWRCLRCGAFVPGEPAGSGPVDQAPVVRRGRELRDAVILRLFAVERAIRFVVFGLLAIGVWRFSLAKDSLREVFEVELPLLRPFTDSIHYDLQHSRLVELIRSALSADPATMRWIILGLVGFCLLSAAEAVGLWMLRRWGEYIAVIGTSIGIPVEINEIVHQVTWLHLLALLVNLALLGYLLYSKRLFGLRGGYAAIQAERRSASVLEVATAADVTGSGR